MKRFAETTKAPRSLISKVIRTGYFLPTMQVDIREIVKKCDKC